MPSFPSRETLTIEFKSDPPSGLSDKAVIESVVGMTNAEGGTLYIGIDDRGIVSGVRSPKWSDPEKATAFIAGNTVPPVIVRAEILYGENGQQVTKIEIPVGRGLTATKDGRVIQRRMKIDKTPENIPVYPQEYATVLSDQGLWDFTDRVLPDTDLDDLDPVERTRLRRLMETYKAEASLLDLEDDELDKALGLVQPASDGSFKPSVAGLLLIGKASRIRTLLPTSSSVFQVLRGTDVAVNDEIRLPLLSSFEELLMRFRARNEETEIQDELIRVPIPDFSERAYREALVNAFVHRDYTVYGSVVVCLTQEDISITSPGGFVRGVHLDNLLVAPPRGRNPLLAGIFKRVGLAEKTGRGIDRIFEGSATYGRPLPDFTESTEGYVRVRLPRAKPNLAFFRRILDYRKRFSRSPSIPALLIMYALDKEPGLSLADLVTRTGYSESRISGQLEALAVEGIIQREADNYRLQTDKKEVKTEAPSDNASVRIEEEGTGDPESVVIKLSRAKGFIRREDVATALSWDAQRAYRLLKKMVASGRLLREGTRRTTVYRIAKTEG